MILLPIFLLISCQTTAEIKVTPVVIPLPFPPEKPDVIFSDNKEEGYIWISYSDGRALAIYLKNMELYQEELNRIIEYYVAVGDE